MSRFSDDPVVRRDVVYNLGNAKMREKQYDDAIGLYSRALKIDRAFDSAYYNRGLCRFYREDHDGLDDLIQAAKLDCQFTPLYEALCRYGISIRGFEGVAKLITSEELPAFAKQHLSKELRTKLLDYLLRSSKLDADSIDKDTLERFCRMADAMSARYEPAKRSQILHNFILYLTIRFRTYVRLRRHSPT